MDENFTEHYKLLVPYIRDLYKVVFLDGNLWSTEHYKLYSDIKRILEKARNNIGPKNFNNIKSVF